MDIHVTRLKLANYPIQKAKIEIPYKFPTFNAYINECRKNKFSSAKMKKQIEEDISWYLVKVPKYTKPVRIIFNWTIGKSKGRTPDLDNLSYAKKFILDSLVSLGKIQDDNRKNVTGFTDNFDYGEEYKVELEIYEEQDI